MHQGAITVVRSVINEVNIRLITRQSKNIARVIHCSFLDNVSNNVHEVQVRIHSKNLQEHILHRLPYGKRIHAKYAVKIVCRNQIKPFHQHLQ